jgi:hypothetical protein
MDNNTLIIYDNIYKCIDDHKDPQELLKQFTTNINVLNENINIYPRHNKKGKKYNILTLLIKQDYNNIIYEQMNKYNNINRKRLQYDLRKEYSNEIIKYIKIMITKINFSEFDYDSAIHASILTCRCDILSILLEHIMTISNNLFETSTRRINENIGLVSQSVFGYWIRLSARYGCESILKVLLNSIQDNYYKYNYINDQDLFSGNNVAIISAKYNHYNFYKLLYNNNYINKYIKNDNGKSVLAYINNNIYLQYLYKTKTPYYISPFTISKFKFTIKMHQKNNRLQYICYQNLMITQKKRTKHLQYYIRDNNVWKKCKSSEHQHLEFLIRHNSTLCIYNYNNISCIYKHTKNDPVIYI